MLAAAWVWWSSSGRKDDAGTAVAVTVPGLSPLATQGERAFGENCAACHGLNAAGSGKGPPLIHKIYEPGHHADMSIVRAVTLGVRAHHWPFGDMPPQTQVTPAQTRAIIAYLREVQRANGIH
jgi:mono/diheme cytochrome c family protein